MTDGFPPRPGGIEHHVRDLASAQAADGHDVAVITTTPAGAARHEAFAVARPPCDAATSPSGGMQHTWIQRALRQPEFAAADVVHIHMSTVSPLAFAAITSSSRRAVPTVVTMHSMVGRARPLVSALQAALGWRRRDVVWTAVSRAAAHQLASVLGTTSPVSVLPNGVDPLAWRCGRHERDAERLTIVCAGRLTPRKRPGALLRMLHAARHRIDHRVRMRLVFAGDGPSHAGLVRYLARNGMVGWVDLIGSRTRDELHEIYAGADLYLAPATLESFGLAALEARCAGLPVIARASSGIADFVTDGVDGVLAPSDKAMIDAVVQLAHDPARHERMLRSTAACIPPLSWNEVLPLNYAHYERAATLVGSLSPTGA
jgi:glycosyltransferase involved in cell wall biosynthesis